jgi:hypothetical protein
VWGQPPSAVQSSELDKLEISYLNNIANCTTASARLSPQLGNGLGQIASGAPPASTDRLMSQQTQFSLYEVLQTEAGLQHRNACP